MHKHEGVSTLGLERHGDGDARATGEAVAARRVAREMAALQKPANVLLDAAGGARLTDFDLVRATDSSAGTRAACRDIRYPSIVFRNRGFRVLLPPDPAARGF